MLLLMPGQPIDYDNAILGHADLNFPLLTEFTGKTLKTHYLMGGDLCSVSAFNLIGLVYVC